MTRAWSGRLETVRWWHREWFRQLVATVVAVPPTYLVPGDYTVRGLLFWDSFALVYLLLTWLTYRRRDSAELQVLGLAARRRPRLAERFVASSPTDLSQAAAVIALLATALIMPRYDSLGAPPGLVFGICVVAVVSCWLTMQTGFMIGYVSGYAAGGGLSFPGTDEPHTDDFVYFTIAVGTSFSTSDVTVTERRMRRQVSVHSGMAFLFNTLIIAATVSIIAAFVSSS
ncbi:DUF1345 domain-containing protein [Pseudonocardia nematodicida]|uniref:DUF1345 domain-containing protein n=1 Tax=Pseudonocardia nematodicida TaxID=1206997 RepID=A0ABV1K9M2_9PSEU